MENENNRRKSLKDIVGSYRRRLFGKPINAILFVLYHGENDVEVKGGVEAREEDEYYFLDIMKCTYGQGYVVNGKKKYLDDSVSTRWENYFGLAIGRTPYEAMKTALDGLLNKVCRKHSSRGRKILYIQRKDGKIIKRAR